MTWTAEKRWIPRRRVVLATIVAVALLIRIVYFIEIASSPCILLHHASETDMSFFDGWARQITAGDVLSARVMPPYHAWHESIAGQYFNLHPNEGRVLAKRAAREHIEPGALLWRDWLGRGRFYQEPLYPYLVALTYAVLGPDPRWIIGWQMLLGVATTALVYLTTRRAFGERVGVVASAIVCLGGPCIYLEAVLVRTTLLIFGGFGLVLLLDRAIERPSVIRWFMTGVACGAAILLQAYFFLFLAIATAFALVPRSSSRALALAGLAAGTVLALGPLVVRNIAVGVPPFALSGAAGVNLIVANAYETGMDGTSFRTAHAAEILVTTRGTALATAFKVLETYHSPIDLLGSLWRKIEATAWWYEQPDNTNFYLFRLHASVLRVLFVNFTLMGSLAAVGLVLAGRRGTRSRGPLYVLAAMSFAVILVFLVRDRFRAPLAAALAPFAAVALTEIHDLLQVRAFARVATLLAMVAALAAPMARPLPHGRHPIRPSDYWLPYEVYYEPACREAEERGDWERAGEVLCRSLRYEPKWLNAIGPSRRASEGDEADIASIFADVHDGYAQALEGAGDLAAAGREKKRAAELRAASGGP